MNINIIGGQLDVWSPFALEIYDNKFVVINTRVSDGIKLYLRSIDPPRVGVSAMNNKQPVIYLPFYINEWKVEID